MGVAILEADACGESYREAEMSAEWSRYRANEIVEEYLHRHRTNESSATEYLKRTIAAYLSSTGWKWYWDGRKEGIRIMTEEFKRGYRP